MGYSPVIDDKARLLVLGTFPSLISREKGYYAHPRNAFWPIVYQVFGGEHTGQPLEEKRKFLLQNGVALWDTVESCETDGSLDTEIKNPVLNDLPALLRRYPNIRKVCFNGGNAARFAKRMGDLGVDTITLPSTSPANARYSYEKKLELWRKALTERE